MLVSLIGLPGSGKSTAGKSLGARLTLPVFDSDTVLERRLGISIREFFELEGEAKFRELEQRALVDLIGQSSGIVSTGGGVVLEPENRKILHRSTRSVYLHSTPAQLFKRLRRDQSRPLLQCDDPLKKLEDLYVERDPLYREVAHLVVQTGEQSISSLVDLIVIELESLGSSSPSQ